MNLDEFVSNYLTNLSSQLDASNTYLTIFAAVLGAVLGIVLSLLVGWFGGKLKTLSYNRIVRQQLIGLTEDNLMRCRANIGVLNNELLRLRGIDGKMTLSGIAALIDYPTQLLHLPASFRSSELFLLRMQISALNAHHAQLINVVHLRESLSIEIRKAPVGQQEWEIVSLRQEYNRHLKTKYLEIIEFTQALQDYLSIGAWKRFLMNFIPTRKFRKMRDSQAAIPTQNNNASNSTPQQGTEPN
ncbi:hypothetical protein R6233_003066 [Vibrio parahaemolyticus]|nr:hypothetical protein [Vibrio parahaemolyticus]MBE4462115.1 hypothetical protein [Vibrio parahaemolyticus]